MTDALRGRGRLFSKLDLKRKNAFGLFVEFVCVGVCELEVAQVPFATSAFGKTLTQKSLDHLRAALLRFCDGVQLLQNVFR